jgi:APA family basic amino acid/polyamine antiporter
VNYVIFIDSLSLASAAFAVFILRKKSQNSYSGFQLKYIWKYLVPIIFVVTLLFVTYNTVLSDPGSATYGFIILIAGAPLYFAIKYILNKETKNEALDSIE